jgi:hypothetical protein
VPAINFPKHRKGRKRRPDDFFQAGPITLARYGRLIVAKNAASPNDIKRIDEAIPTNYAETKAVIESEIGALRTLLAPLDPVKFLNQAFAERFAAHLGFEDEPSLTFDDHAIPARVIDYCQSLFAAMPAPPQVRPHTEEEFQRAKAHIRKLFHATRDYIFLSAHPLVSGKTKDALAELVAKLTYFWIFVRSDRHAYFELPHYRDLLTPIDAILRRVLKVSSSELLEGLKKLLTNAQSGIGDAGIRLFEMFDAASNHPEFDNLFKSDDGYDVNDLAKLTGMITADIEDALFSFVGTKLFEVKTTTKWPDHLVQLLSYSPGDAASFLEPEQHAAWPTRVWPIFQRPFLYVEGEAYCFDHIALCDRFYRQLTRFLRTIDPACATQLKEIQSANTENLAANFLQKLLPGATVLRNAFYECDGEFCETDLLVIYKDTLIVSEIRSGSITPESPTEDLPSYFSSIQNLLLKPSTQAWRLLKLLRCPVDLFDSNKANRKLIARLEPSQFKLRIPMAVSLDSLQMMGAHLANTLAAIEQNTPATWVVTLDDLRCFAELFDSPSTFLHFTEIRLRAAAHDKVEVLDELDHVGMYFRENDYVMQSEEFNSPLNRYGYTTDIDRYFFQLGAGETAERPRQGVPRQIANLISLCDRSSRPISRELASVVLNTDSESRTQIDGWLSTQLTAPPDFGRLRSYVLTFNLYSISLMASRNWGFNSIQQAFVEAKARLLTMTKIERSLVALFQFEADSFKLISCDWIEKADIGDKERDSLRTLQRDQERRDFAAIGKIGRNEICPCGSGRKYKHCHGR